MASAYMYEWHYLSVRIENGKDPRHWAIRFRAYILRGLLNDVVIAEPNNVQYRGVESCPTRWWLFFGEMLAEATIFV